MKKQQKFYHEILRECASIAEDRQKQYGEASASLQVACNIAKEAFGIDITVDKFALLMVALKLSRQKFGYKRDNMVDGINYLAISLNEIDKQND